MEIIQTKEHWGRSVFEVVDNDGRAIAQCWRGSSEQNLADAERIAAMWDALRGFTTAEIKEGLDLAAINLSLKATKAMLAAETARADKAEQQRDELLAHHWQPIETAPKDELTYVLLGYWPAYMQGEQQGGCPEIAYWGSDVWITNNGRRLGTRGAFAHTHWMPLPPAPASVKGGE